MMFFKSLCSVLTAFFGRVLAVARTQIKEADAKAQANYRAAFLRDFFNQNYVQWANILYRAVAAVDGVSGLRQPRAPNDLGCYSPNMLPVRMLRDGRPCLEYHLWRTVPFREETAADLEFLIREELKNVCAYHGFPVLTAKLVLDPKSNGRMVRVFLAVRGRVQ